MTTSIIGSLGGVKFIFEGVSYVLLVQEEKLFFFSTYLILNSGI